MAGNKPKSQQPKGKTPPVAASSRSRTRERREERQRQKRRQQQLAALGVVAVVAFVAVLGIVLRSLPQDAPIPEGTTERYAGIPQDTTEEGFPRLGRPDAPVEVVEYSSFSCDQCAAFHEENFDGILELVRDGSIALVYVPVTTTGGAGNPNTAASAALCAAEQGQFFQYHDALFRWQRDYLQRAFIEGRLSGGIRALELDEGAYDSCRGSGRPGSVIDTANAEFSGSGATGTPAIFVDGTPVASNIGAIRNQVQQRLAATGAVPIPLSEGDAVPEATTEATAEGTEAVEADETPDVTEAAATDEETPEATETGD
jgi:protein-disulfide isomerase